MADSDPTRVLSTVTLADGVTEPPAIETLTDEGRLSAYRMGLRTRATITQCLVEMRKGTVRFWIGGPGEEIHGTATALAIHRFEQELGTPEGEWSCGLFPHYRSDALAGMLAELRGHDDFTRAYFRQAMSRATDAMTSSRQMVMHLSMPERGIFPVQSPLGMNLGKAAGFAQGRKLRGLKGVTVAVCGDGTSATSDFHEAFQAAGLWELGLVFIITDNNIAISVQPDEGRAIKDYESYARAFRCHYMACDGYDFDATYQTTLEALRWVGEHGRSCLIHARVPRLRGHSSSDGAVFRYDYRDPLLEFGQQMLDAGVLSEGQVFARKATIAKHDYFEDHALGELMTAEIARIKATLERVRQEPEPVAGDQLSHARPPFLEVVEPDREGSTAVQINEALNLCLHRQTDEGNTLIWGQDIAGTKGGVFKVTRGLSGRHPKQVFNAPINEPLIVGTAVGAALDPSLRTMPEIQFGDYSLNTLHWLVHAGNLYWGSGGRVAVNVTLRTPVDPVAGGALYHSMSIEGFFAPVPGWVVICVCTAFDAYGLLRTAGDYAGPVLFLEPKALYRRTLGPCLPGEPVAAVCRATRRRSGESLLGPADLAGIEDYRIPFGKAALRRRGEDLTVVAWGHAVNQALEAAVALAKDGISAEVLDLRTLSPWDTEAVLASAEKTGRVLIAHQDRVYGGFGREIQGTVHEAIEGIATRVVGMKRVPAVAQAKALEEDTVLQPSRIEAAARELLRRPAGAFANNAEAWLQYAPTRRRI